MLLSRYKNCSVNVSLELVNIYPTDCAETIKGREQELQLLVLLVRLVWVLLDFSQHSSILTDDYGYGPLHLLKSRYWNKAAFPVDERICR